MNLLKTFVCIALLYCSAMFSQEEILAYHTHIQVEESGDLLIEEQITVRAAGYQIRRGIFRTFPTRYKDKVGNRYRVGFEVLEVLRDGEPDAYHIKNQSNGKVIYIGDEKTYLTPGQYTYTLKYRTSRQLGFFEGYDELYYNAIGGDWSFTIQQGTVTVELPESAQVDKQVAYSGSFGSSGCNCVFDKQNNKAYFKLTQMLHPYEQFTIALSWQKGIVKEPTRQEKIFFFIQDNFHLIGILIGLLAVFWAYYSKWKKVGVDPPKGVIIPLFDPPENFSPAQIAFLHQMGFSQRAITAAIVNMAVHGYLTIKQEHRDYRLEKNKNAKTWQLSSEEAAIANTLLESRNSIKLDNTNHKVFSKMRAKVQKNLKEKLKPTFLVFNAKALYTGLIVSGILLVFTLLAAPFYMSIIVAVLIVSGALIFNYLMKAPTEQGRKIMDEIEGFKMYINTAEQRQLDSIEEPELTPERFEALLPYAIALGVENKWGKRFENVLKKTMQDQDYNPVWYTGGKYTAFNATSFTNSVGRSFSSAISSSATPPGSSSGSGGGGFSGGGGGGGGGGGW